MGKKKSFIDKKNSATFMLLARDTSTFPGSASSLVPSASDRVFVRVDNNRFNVPGVFEEDDCGNDGAVPETAGLKVGDDVYSIFADAPGDTDDEGSFSQPCPSHATRSSSSPYQNSNSLSDEVRKEILDLGLPDDGYNYLQHLREISNAGAGSAYYQNSKARLDLVPTDVKAFDASRLKISGVESNKNSIYAVASKAIGVKVQKAVDPDIARLLDDSDLSRFGSDTEDFEEDFVFKANVPDGNMEKSEAVEEAEPGVDKEERKMCLTKAEKEDESLDEDDEDELDCDKPRIHRLLDEQFDLLALREYGDTYSDDNGYLDEEGETIVAKLRDTLKEYKVEDLEFDEKYRVPADYVHKQEAPSMGIQLNDSTDVISKCREYAEKYCNEDEDEEKLIVVEESSDELEVWDCETIVSTYSNLDNHPGIIQTPDILKRNFAKNLPVNSIKKTNMIELGGKEKLPMEFLPHAKRDFAKVKKPAGGFEKQQSKPRREESQDEKKERKAAVRGERREARRAKKELKGLYRCETHKAQKVAAVSMPPAIHLM